ncbi:MAG: hypothetical protein H6980_03660 [Gammaproteobacteria bacterium]|nr:hypothetical protein [Gammaproteobacteria bacterium]
MNASNTTPLDERIAELERAAWFAGIASIDLAGWRAPERAPTPQEGSTAIQTA